MPDKPIITEVLTPFIRVDEFRALLPRCLGWEIRFNGLHFAGFRAEPTGGLEMAFGESFEVDGRGLLRQIADGGVEPLPEPVLVDDIIRLLAGYRGDTPIAIRQFGFNRFKARDARMVNMEFEKMFHRHETDGLLRESHGTAMTEAEMDRFCRRAGINQQRA